MSIQDLPLEIFVHVIRLVCLPTDGALDHVAAACLALVCRKWHRTIVDTPHLWAQLDGSVPFIVLEKCLDRSRGVALRLVRTRRLTAMPVCNFHRIVGELDRVKEVSFVFQESDWVSLAREEPFLDHVPLLESFHLQIIDDRVDGSSENSEEGSVDADEEEDSVDADEEESISSDEEGGEDSSTDDEGDQDEADDGGDIVKKEGEGEDEEESGEEEEEDAETDSDDDADSSPRHTLPPHIFSGCKPPRLRRLSLSNIRVPWDSSLLSNLTHLHLISQDRPTYAEFVTSFEHMPSLVSLHLKHCLPLSPDHIPQIKSIIILNQLRSIVIADDSELCAWFLDAVEMTPTSVRMFCYNNLASALVLYQASADYLSRATTPLLGVDLKACTRERSGLYEYVNDDEDNSFVTVLKVLSDSHARKGPPFMDIHMALAFDPHEDVNVERAFLEIIAAIHRPLQPIHILTCNITPFVKVSDEFWLELDRCFPNLIVLSLTPADMNSFLDAYWNWFCGRRVLKESVCCPETMQTEVPFQKLKEVVGPGADGSKWTLTRMVLDMRRRAGCPLAILPSISDSTAFVTNAMHHGLP